MKEEKEMPVSEKCLLTTDLRSLSMDELMALAEQENIEDKWDLNKNGLIRALEKLAK